MNEKVKKDISKYGEDKAISLLISKGYKILKRNYFSAYGEIDIIGLFNDTVVFCEVKTRTTLSSDFDIALRAVSKNKQNKMKKTAQIFLSKNPIYENFFTSFDVIAILINPATKLTNIYHLSEAFG
jgi:putative endonuclease